MENLFDYLIENENFHLKYAKGEPSVEEREFHRYHEFVYFIEGEAKFVSKNVQQNLLPDSLLLIPEEQFHQFFVNHPAAYTRCIIGFRGTPKTDRLIREVFNDIKVISMENKKVKNLFENLIEIIKSNLSHTEKEMFIDATIIQLLVFFKQFASRKTTKHLEISPMVQKAISFIDKNYMKKISVESIAKTLYISPSTLTHKFKKELNISVYQYISKKRVFAVQKLIEAGESYSEAAVKCGFSDYSCFYRIRKKYYST